MKGPTADADAEQERGAGVCSAEGKHGGGNKNIFTKKREKPLRKCSGHRGQTRVRVFR